MTYLTIINMKTVIKTSKFTLNDIPLGRYPSLKKKNAFFEIGTQPCRFFLVSESLKVAILSNS